MYQQHSFAKLFMNRLIVSLAKCLPVVFGLILIVGCSQEKHSTSKIIRYIPSDSLNDLILNNMCNKKIVMLGDGAHGNGYYWRLLIGVMNKWVDELEKEKRYSNQGIGNKDNQRGRALPHKLILFIEADQIVMDTIKHFIESNNLNNLLMWHIQAETEWGSREGGVSVDEIEFLADIKKITDRVRKLNEHKISPVYDLRIDGPESTPPQQNYRLDEARADLQQIHKERLEWFVQKRDELSSSNMKKMLDDNPGYKALIFYGSAHLLRGFQNKTLGKVQYGIDTVHGYYLVHYLDLYFSRDSVTTFFTINQVGLQHERVEECERGAAASDYLVYCNPIPPAQCPLEFINCTATLDVLLHLMEMNAVSNTKEGNIYSRSYGLRFYYQLRRSCYSESSEIKLSLDSLKRYVMDTSKAFQKRKILLAEKLIKKFDAVQNINSLEEWIAQPMRDSTIYLPMLKMVLSNFPTKDALFYDTRNINISLGEDTKKRIESRKEDVIEYLLINLLWIGSSAERAKAMNELTSRTKVKFKNAKEWSEWWRLKYRSQYLGERK